MPTNAIRVTRPGPHGNPFRIGDWAKIGDVNPSAAGPFRRMAYTISLLPDQPGFTLISSNALAVEFFRQDAAGWSPARLARVRAELRGHDLACWCALDSPCHGDMLIELANQ